MSVEQYEALLEASERQRAVAAALASVRAEGLEPSAEDLTLFVDVAAGQMTTDEFAEPYPVALPAVSGTTGEDPYLDPASGAPRNLLGNTDPGELAQVEAGLAASGLIDLERRRLPGKFDLDHLRAFHRYILGDVFGRLAATDRLRHKIARQGQDQARGTAGLRQTRALTPRVPIGATSWIG